MLVTPEPHYKLRPEVLFGSDARQGVERAAPGNFTFGTVLDGRRCRRWIVQTADRDAYFLPVELEKQRRSAVPTITALRQARAFKDGRCSARSAQIIFVKGGKCHKRLTRGLLAHPAVTDTTALGQPFQLIAERAALATAA